MGLFSKVSSVVRCVFSVSDGEDAACSRLQHSQIRTCPEYVLRDLRRIDPSAELLYVGTGRWWLGSVRWNRDLVQRAGITLTKLRQSATQIEFGISRAEHIERLKANAERQALLRLMVQGFRFITEYADPIDSRVVHDFQLRDWNYRVCPEETVEDHVQWSEGVPQLQAKLALLRDAARGLALPAYRHVSRGKGGFVVQPGLRGTA